MVPEFTARQRAAFSFTALVKREAHWRDIDWERLSFTEPGQDPAGQLYPSIDVAFRVLWIRPGDIADLGFVASGEADARELEAAWKELAPPGQHDDHPHDRKAPP